MVISRWCIKRRAPIFLYSEKGIVLPVGLVLLLLLAIIGGVVMKSTSTELKLSSNLKGHTEAFYAAEAGLAKAVAEISKFTSAPTISELVTITPPVLSNPDINFTAFSVQQLSSGAIVINDGGPYNGLNATESIYLITSEASLPSGSRSRLTQKLKYLEIPLFQFGVFYGEGVNLEISPGPAMTFNGRVHSNSNLYLAGGNPLKFDSYVTTTGEVYRYQKMDPSDRSNNPQIKDAGGVYRDLNFDHEYDYNFINPWSETDWKNAANTTFGGLLQDNAHGVEKIIPPVSDLLYDPLNPDVASHQMIEMGDPSDTPEMKQSKLYYKADLRIEDGVWKDGSGSPVAKGGCDPNTVKTETFYDPREQKNVTVTEVDIGKLTACGKAPANGVLYVQKSDGVSGVGAVRLVNGAELPSQGLTVVSENPVYVQGDYNTINKVPAAVMGDAITVLSNNWDSNGSDTKGTQNTSDRPASSTSVNAAFALGPNRESTSTYNNGGLENAIRFLEDWKGETFSYRGSILGLWHTQSATSDHRCCGNGSGQYYNPPVRNWGYDTLFDTQQPPGTPKGIVIIKLSWVEVV